MRTAHEWYLKINSFSNPNTMNDVEREWIEKIINEARIEAIKECAEKAELHKVGNARKDMPTGSNFKSETVYVPVYEVNKLSILKLINEVK